MSEVPAIQALVQHEAVKWNLLVREGHQSIPIDPPVTVEAGGMVLLALGGPLNGLPVAVYRADGSLQEDLRDRFGDLDA